MSLYPLYPFPLLSLPLLFQTSVLSLSLIPLIFISLFFLIQALPQLPVFPLSQKIPHYSAVLTTYTPNVPILVKAYNAGIDVTFIYPWRGVNSYTGCSYKIITLIF